MGGEKVTESQRGVKIPGKSQQGEVPEMEDAALVIDKSTMYRFIYVNYMLG